MPLSSSSSDRAGQIRALVVQHLSDSESGVAVSDDEFLQVHSDLLPELQDELRKLKLIRRVGRDVAGNNPTIDSAAHRVTPPMRPGRRPTAQELGDYELLDEIGAGGMGIVYRAWQRPLNRVVALKMLRAGDMATEEELRRFHAEAETAAALDHPGIVPIFEVGSHESCVFFAMAYVDGQSLSEVLREQLPTPTQSARYVRDIAQAVEYAHRQGVLHRDLKPSNVLVDQHDHVRITDFGLAKRVAGDANQTASGRVLGTPSYMSPEQAVGDQKRMGPASDVYSLGAVLYELLTGRPPFRSDEPLKTLRQVIEWEPPRPRSLAVDVPRDLETICLKCLEKDPARRYGSAQELADDLDRYLRGEPIVARPVGPVERAWRWCRKRPAAAALVAVALLAATASPAIMAYQRQLRETAAHSTEEAERQSQVRQVLALVNESEVARGNDPAQSLRLAITAVEQARGLAGPMHPAAQQALLDALDGLGGRPASRKEAAAKGVVAPSFTPPKHGTPVPTTIERRLTSANQHWEIVATAKLVEGRYQESGDAYLRRLASTINKPPANVASVIQPIRLTTTGLERALFTADGRWLAVVGDNQTLRLWDLRSTPPKSVELPASTARPGSERDFPRLAATPDHRWLIAQDRYGNVRLWDLDSPEPAKKSLDLPGAMALLDDGPLTREGDATTPDARHWSVARVSATVSSRWLVALGHDGALRACDLAAENPARAIRRWEGTWPRQTLNRRDAQQRVTLVHNSDGLNSHGCQALLLGESQLIAARAAQWHCYDLRSSSPKPMFAARAEAAGDVAVSPDGRWLFAAAKRDSAAGRLWDLTGPLPGEHPRLLTGLPAAAWRTAFSPDGKWLAAVSMPASAIPQACVRLWRVADIERGAMQPVSLPGAYDVAFSSDGRYLACGGANDAPGATVWDLHAGSFERPRWTFPAEKPRTCVVFSTQNMRLAAGGSDGSVLVYDLSGMDPAAKSVTLTGDGERVTRVVLGGDGRLVAATTAVNTTRLWRIADDGSTTCDVLQDKEWPNVRGALALARGWLIGKGPSRGDVWIWDTQRPHGEVRPLALLPVADPTGALPVRPHDILSLTVSADERWLVTGSMDGQVRVWDIAQFDRARTSGGAATSSNEGGAWPPEPRVWELPNPQPISDVAIRLDGPTVVATSFDGAAYHWRFDSPDLPPVLFRGPPGDVTSLATSPDQHWLATSHPDGSVRLWNQRIDELLRAARTVLGE